MNGVEFLANFPEIEQLARACENDEEFELSFGSERACEEWFYRARWPTGFVCPRCRHPGGGWQAGRRVWQCGVCRRQTSLTSGTLLQATRKPLRTWFEAAYLIIQRGVNARTLQRKLGLTYKTAWSWCHKLRGALRGREIPVDAEADERRVHDASRVKGGSLLDPHPNRREPCACTRLRERDWGFPDEIEEEAEALEYLCRRALGYRDEPVVPEDAPPMHDASAAWELLATYRGSVTEKHLRAYLDELAFRRNWRRRDRGAAFLTVARALASEPARPYRAIVATAAPTGHPLSIWTWSRLPEAV